MNVYAHVAIPTTRPKIILNMIVRNEEVVIRRCLESVKPYIDEWCIVDTGSTDRTKEIIVETMSGITGALHDAEWKNFEHNRNDALNRIKNVGAYVLFIDADEVLKAPEGFHWPSLTADAYHLPVTYAGTSYVRVALVANRLEWRWKGSVHEFLESTTPAKFETLTAPAVIVYHEGARSRNPDTYVDDAHLLEAELKKNPNDPRTTFYLAQSWKDAGHPLKAKFYYQQRAMLGGFDEEKWYAMYEIGRMNERIGAPIAQIRDAYLEAYNYRPTRAEPLYQLARLHRERREWHLAFMFAHIGGSIPYPADKLFVDNAVYHWRLKDELSILCYYVGEMEYGKQITKYLLNNNPSVPEDQKPRIADNLKFYQPEKT